MALFHSQTRRHMVKRNIYSSKIISKSQELETYIRWTYAIYGFSFLQKSSLKHKKKNHTLDEHLPYIYIYLHSQSSCKATFLAACISWYKTLKCHVIQTAPLGGVTSTPANNVLCLSTFAWSHTRMAKKLCSGVLLSGCSNTSVTNEIFHFIKITDGVEWTMIQ